jgi:hypothetical protein
MPLGVRIIDKISELSDISVVNVQDNDVLIYNSTNQKWENGSSSGGGPHTHPWTDITSTPTTLSGYGITDAASSSHNHSGVYAPASGSIDIVTLGTIVTGTWNASTIPITKGGTGQTSASDAINALLPSQVGNTDKFLKTNGTTALWATPPSGSGAAELSKSFTYDGDGRLSVITDSSGTKTLSYNLDGTLNQIVGTGPYVTKTFSYNLDGTLSGISVS